MTKNVLVSITSLHQNDTENGSIQSLVQGTYRYIQGRHIICYEEILEENFDGEPSTTHCLLKITEDTISLTKRGQANTEMHFQSGKDFRGLYGTPLGSFQMYLHTSHLNITESGDSISIDLEYSLELNGSHISNCCLKIDIKSCHSKE